MIHPPSGISEIEKLRAENDELHAQFIAIENQYIGLCEHILKARAEAPNTAARALIRKLEYTKELVAVVTNLMDIHHRGSHCLWCQHDLPEHDTSCAYTHARRLLTRFSEIGS